MPDSLGGILDDIKRDLSSVQGRARVGIFSKPEEAQKLAWTDAGTTRSPARPTLTQAADANEERVIGLIEQGVDAALARGGGARQALGPAARFLKDKTVEAIDANRPPPLAPSTIAGRLARGNTSTATLVDTGAMRDAVEFEVTEGAA